LATLCCRRSLWDRRGEVGHRSLDGRRGPITGPQLFFDLADEAEALAMNSADQTLRFAAVADRLPHSIDMACQGRLGHDSAVPDSLDQIVLADHALSVLQ